MTTATATPYNTAAWEIAESGLGSPIPLPFGRKYPPPRGVTGREGAAPDRRTIEMWRHTGTRNVAIRLDHYVVGIDVDAHDGRPGGATLTRLEEIHGPLPATWMSTARHDDTSGIRLYRVEESTATMRDPGPGIEVIRRHHRYLLAAPSRHPNGDRYRWVGPGHGEESGPPDLGQLPLLPRAWVAHLHRRCECAPR